MLFSSLISLPVLSLLLVTPLIGSLVIFLRQILGCNEKKPRRDFHIALGVTLLSFLISTFLILHFDAKDVSFQFVEKYNWISSLGLSYFVGVDGVSISFVLLTTFLMPLVLVAGKGIKDQSSSFFALLLLLETMILGVFLSLNIVLFYVFFEGVLIPMFFIIGLWGGEKRIYAATKFFLYSFVGSVLMLAAIFVMAHYAHTTEMVALMDVSFPKEIALFLWLGFFASFAIKTPLWPFHTWLPDAHGEAPTAGSMVLAGLLLKLGLYGFLRIGMQILPQAQSIMAPYIMIIAVVGVLYASFVALVQTDMKRLIAYTSIAHMAFAIAGLFSGYVEGVKGALMLALSHGVVSAGLFAGAGILYDRKHTRQIKDYAGMASIMPRFAFVYMVIVLAALGLPGTSGFVGEFLALFGFFKFAPVAAVLSSFGLVLSAAIFLWFYGRIFYGKTVQERGEDVEPIIDISRLELSMFSVMVIFVIVVGIVPMPFLNVFSPTVETISSIYQKRTSQLSIMPPSEQKE